MKTFTLLELPRRLLTTLTRPKADLGFQRRLVPCPENQRRFSRKALRHGDTYSFSAYRRALDRRKVLQRDFGTQPTRSLATVSNGLSEEIIHFLWSY